jgi:hypothetical protein
LRVSRLSLTRCSFAANVWSQTRESRLNNKKSITRQMSQREERPRRCLQRGAR